MTCAGVKNKTYKNPSLCTDTQPLGLIEVWGHGLCHRASAIQAGAPIVMSGGALTSILWSGDGFLE